MPIIPKIPKPTDSTSKVCAKCGKPKPINQFAFTHNEFYSDKHLPFCNECISALIEESEDEWETVDKLCQWADIPFVVKEWERIKEMTWAGETWGTYAKVFSTQEYEHLGWKDYYRQYKKLKEVGIIEEEIPEVREKRYRELRRKWGENYVDEELNRLEDLYKGLLNTQNVVGALQIDQAQKLCKLSLQIDNCIREGSKDTDKFLAAYDKIIKAAEFTPKNTKNATDFDSFAEVAYWLEKKGKINKFYDNVTRDVVDETLKNIQSYNQRLYVNEGGIGEEITTRLDALRAAVAYEQNEESSLYDIQPTFNPDEYDNAGYIIDGEEDDFNPEEI